ncbi:HNH endonuclease [Kiloniella sp. b19]|uniref:HNH endonuclease n=1 Tax=Kiloniella sp. GXU_MW_B19 TaxID=3141326 RepID=UPI0031D0CF29
MTKAILTSKPTSIYNDLVEFRYHFPATYLRQVTDAVGDWVIYYEPRRLTTQLNIAGGRQSYFATAKINRVERDPERSDHYYAYVTDYLEFDHPVPFKEQSFYYESRLRKEDGSTNKGNFGRSVRSIPDEEYNAILTAGFHKAVIGEDAYYAAIQQEQSQRQLTLHSVMSGMAEEQEAFQAGSPKIRDKILERVRAIAPRDEKIITKLVSRPFRDEAFKHAVRQVYGNTCALTGLSLVNGGGRPEVQAAHIQPVAQKGPDSIRNGLALSGTVHWMFDRGLISIHDDYRILTADQFLPKEAKALLNKDGVMRLPDREDERPHQQFLEYHRDTIFKG